MINLKRWSIEVQQEVEIVALALLIEFKDYEFSFLETLAEGICEFASLGHKDAILVRLAFRVLAERNEIYSPFFGRLYMIACGLIMPDHSLDQLQAVFEQNLQTLQSI